jgi:hypothetical protein
MHNLSLCITPLVHRGPKVNLNDKFDCSSREGCLYNWWRAVLQRRVDAFPQADLQILDAERGVCNPCGISLYQIQTVGRESTDL